MVTRAGREPRKESELPVDFRFQCLLLANVGLQEEVSETVVERAAAYVQFVLNGDEETRPWRLEALRLANSVGEDAPAVVNRARVYYRFIVRNERPGIQTPPRDPRDPPLPRDGGGRN